MDGSGSGFRKLSVLGVRGDRFPGDRLGDYNAPRTSRHSIKRRSYLPLEKVRRPMTGGAMIHPWPPRPFDLVHGWNRVPVGPTPFVVGFEWHIPLSWEHMPRSFNFLMDVLVSDRCRKIVAASQGAATITEHRHVNDPRLEAIKKKITVRLPNVMIPDIEDWFDPAAAIDQLRLVFVGDNFGTQGGCVAVKLAEKARAAGLPVHITVVSALTSNRVDPERANFQTPYKKMLDQPNITYMAAATSEKVLELISRAHLTLLPTLNDCYDFNGMDGMARFTPMMVTATGAFPEFIDANSGVLLPVQTTCQGEWKFSEWGVDRAAPAYDTLFADTVENLAEQALAACASLINNPARLGELRRGARRMAEEKLHHEDASRFWDSLYLEALDKR